MLIEKIEFLCSSPSLKECPKQDLPEFAFIGRSNVGKSSLINMLADRKALAKVSGTPGKTRLINHFKVSPSPAPSKKWMDSSSIQHPASSHPASSWFLVDLPGYGFAKLSKTVREKFEKVIRDYLLKRENLACTFLLIDSRIEPQKIDLEFMNWLGDHDISFIILFTKADKLSKTDLNRNLKNYQTALSAHWDELPVIIITSAETRQGREETLTTIERMLTEIGGA